ncbi:DUF2203 domain-containing protein [Planktothrix sp. FACHB-1355]|uniref:DUF2203 domain-containing protein n=1 Tax=Aerosakkonema funiforme FACHB-1375 TaxID=2949571 RepID=A0A926VK53_9CYAN|nr:MULTISPECIES: DUF2203 domain-containing protein [Oscillatoriales]MBD2185372.1 DUF2203 domain-containing protein [Aerosakkonema funiforme FACHB-1375]MBD3559015.1 DUF2203 domain-containing protein [Planktothrix sp. FACHB-1355]
MKPDREPSQRSPNESADFEREFVQGLEEVERSLQALQERYAQVQQDKQRQAELKHRYEDVRQELRTNRSPQLKAELQQIQQQLEILEVNLESSLFSWSSLKEPFWMAVRFGGIGIAIGWLLKSCSG